MDLKIWTLEFLHLNSLIDLLTVGTLREGIRLALVIAENWDFSLLKMPAGLTLIYLLTISRAIDSSVNRWNDIGTVIKYLPLSLFSSK